MSNKIFKRNELERLNCVTDEDIELVLQHKKKLPVLCNNDSVDEFSVDARLLHKQLGVSKVFSKWIKNNLKDYAENTDYITAAPREIAQTAATGDISTRTCFPAGMWGTYCLWPH